MSKKNKNQQSIIPLAQILVPLQVVLILPPRTIQSNISQTLLKAYIKAKLDKKKIYVGFQFVTTILGIEQQLQIIKINFQQPNTQSQKQSNQQKNQKMIVVGCNTIISFEKKVSPQKNIISKKLKKVGFFGRQVEYNTLKSIIEKGLRLNEDLMDSGLGTVKGVLISGGGGTGKTLLVKKVEEQLTANKINFKMISSFNLLNKYVGGAEQALKTLFQQLKQIMPCCLVIQDLHLIFSKNMKNENETTLASLLTQMENINYDQPLIVIATYNSQRDLHENLHRSGKFQKQIHLEMPRHHQRLQILKGYLNMINLSNQISDEELKRLNLRMNGFSIGQIQQILRDSYLEKGKQMNGSTIEDILKGFKPKEIKQLIVEVPQVYWREIGGYQDVKKNIIKVIEWPLRYPQAYNKLGIQSMKGILLYGPPGCSKTMMAKAIATESKLNFIGIKGPQLFSKYVGESERAVRNIFKRARACSPCVIFFDEIDALATQREGNTQVSDRILCQLLNEMDGVEGLKEVIIVAATNRPQIIDKALLRPGRFDHLIYVGPPNLQARKQILKIYLSKMPIKQDRQNIVNIIAGETIHYTGAELSLICRTAALQALSSNFQDPQVNIQHFKIAKSKVKNRLNQEILFNYEKFSSTLTYI